MRRTVPATLDHYVNFVGLPIAEIRTEIDDLLASDAISADVKDNLRLDIWADQDGLIEMNWYYYREITEDEQASADAQEEALARSQYEELKKRFG